ncbi:MAG: CHAT domain-containing protein [Rhizonema sp. PD37]|nr:CHAT domain-containing protein [Rhizonema sp. PD37]
MDSTQPIHSNNPDIKTILILAANPEGTSRLQLDKEVREIDEGLRRASLREQFRLEQKWAVRQRDFYRAILDYQPQIVHFSGHGAGVDGIVLENEADEPAFVNADALASMFKLFATKGVECVLLNACYSEVQAKAISQHVNYVIGMNRTIGDKAAIAFSVAFYDAIAAGQQMEFAYELGCSVLISYLEQQTPVLLKKNKISIIQPLRDVIPPNPYLGLAAFTEVDAAFFFGREIFVNGLVEAVNKQPLVGVIGPSGSGKSSVVYAGLFPKLRITGNWLIESIRPGDQPFYQLASVLVRLLEPSAGETAQLREAVGLAADMEFHRITLPTVISRLNERQTGKRLLLFIDQFEELYTLCQNKEVIERFVDALLAAINLDNFILVFTLRADFYNFVLAYRPFRDALQQFSPQLLSSMNREECKRAIEQPAQKMSVQLEAQLTERILDDVGNEPGHLPLLEFALTQLWSLQQKRLLTHQAYNEIGGVKKALANHAEEVYKRLDEQKQTIVPRIFVQLVRPGEGTEDTRRIATRAEVGDENWGLVSYLAGYPARLVVTGRDEKSLEDTVEVIHEALIREWLTLREWMNANRQFRVWQERLKVAMEEWVSSNHDLGALLRGGPLTVAQEWLHERSDEITQQERDFIVVSIQQRNREKQEIERRRKRTKNGLICAFVGALSLAGFANWQWQRAEKQKNTVADLLVEQPKALFEQGYQLESLIASVKVMKKLQEIKSDNQSHLYKLKNLISGIHEINQFPSKENVTQLSFSPNGDVIASVQSDGTIKLCQTNPLLSQKRTCLNKEIKHKIHSLSFSPKEYFIIAGSDDGFLFILNENKDIEYEQKVHNRKVSIIKFNLYGNIFASLSDDVKIWNKKGRFLNKINEIKDSNKTISISFSPDENIFALGKEDGRIEIWKQRTKLTEIKDSNSRVHDISFSSDGSTIASASWSGTLTLWKKRGTSWNNHYKVSLHDPKQIVPVGINSVSFSHNGDIIASGDQDGILRLWRKDGSFLDRFNCKSFINAVAFNPQDNIVSCATDNDLQLWSLTKLMLSTNSTTDLNTLIQSSCAHLRNYFIVNPMVLNENKNLCP